MWNTPPAPRRSDHAVRLPRQGSYLEHPLWPDGHKSVLAALRDALAPLFAPRYYVGLERRTYFLSPDDLVLIGVTDVAVLQRGRPENGVASARARPSSRSTCWIVADYQAGEEFPVDRGLRRLKRAEAFVAAARAFLDLPRP